jgi:putative flippase GtrA
MLELHQQFIRFAGVGVTSAIGHYGLLILLTQFAAVDAVIASSAGAVLGAAINYSMNYRFTFRSNKRHRESMSKFAVVAAIGLLLNTFFMWVGVHVLAVYYLVSQIATTGLVLLWSFSANRYWTFYHKPERE